ncbi:hypothetical protein D3C84_1022670 [compost metagenome]
MEYTGATDYSKDILRQGLSNADGIVDEIRRSFEEDESIDDETRLKYDNILEKLSITVHRIKEQIDYI